jgi:peptide-methionine (S)-S-oxide reductase
MKFIPKTKQEMAVFAGGCFWCVEAVFKMIRGVLSLEPGYAGGGKEDPTYDEVSAGNTGHAETVKIDFDSQEVSYEDLLNIFFYSHDPTSVNRQGNDIGPQYRSLIFYVSEKQKEIAEKFIKSLESTNAYKEKITTELRPFVKFYPAEDYHKNYFEKNKNAQYCQLVVALKVTKAREKFKSLLR